MYNLTTTEKINVLLKERKISKAQFYKDCGISSAAYSLWNQGKTNPSMKNLITIAEYLGVTVASLLDGTKNPPPAQEPVGLPDDIVKLLRKADDTQLQEIARYAEYLIGRE